MEAIIDLNADLGETVDGAPTADDEAMFAVISSASIACGGHAGDEASMREAIERAARFGVSMGAHPSFIDRAGFGRFAPPTTPKDLRDQVRGQLERLLAAGADLAYVKPHGALYHRVTEDRQTSDAVTAAIAEVSDRVGHALPVLGLGGFIIESAAARGLPFFREAFLDRGYLASGALVPRTAPGALLDDADAVAARAVRLVTEGVVEAIDGKTVS